MDAYEMALLLSEYGFGQLETCFTNTNGMVAYCDIMTVCLRSYLVQLLLPVSLGIEANCKLKLNLVYAGTGTK